MTSTYTDLVRRALLAGYALGACPTPNCLGDVWQLRRQPQTGKWRVAELGGTGRFVVAGPAATCPWCRAPLLALPYRVALQRQSPKPGQA